MSKTKDKKEAEKKEFQKIEYIVEKSFDEVSKLIKKSNKDTPRARMGTIVFS